MPGGACGRGGPGSQHQVSAQGAIQLTWPGESGSSLMRAKGRAEGRRGGGSQGKAGTGRLMGTGRAPRPVARARPW